MTGFLTLFGARIALHVPSLLERGTELGVQFLQGPGDLPVRYIKIVVTDDQGRYVLPELPKQPQQQTLGLVVLVAGVVRVD